MTRLHRIFANGNAPLKKFLDDHGIAHDYQESIVGKTVFLLIAETDPNWNTLASHLAYNTDLFHTTELSFSRRDILRAECCLLGVTSHYGYPQPEDGYRRATYRIASGCSVCGVGWVQEAPFRFRRAPTQKRTSLLQLNWIFDEFLVSRHAREQLDGAGFPELTYEAPVLHKTGESIPQWYQMMVRTVSRPLVDTTVLHPELCTRCGTTKYNHPQADLLRVRNPFRDAGSDIVKSYEWFGSGASAHRLLFVSPRFVRFAIDSKWRGVALTPCELTDDRGNRREAA